MSNLKMEEYNDVLKEMHNIANTLDSRYDGDSNYLLGTPSLMEIINSYYKHYPTDSDVLRGLNLIDRFHELDTHAYERSR